MIFVILFAMSLNASASEYTTFDFEDFSAGVLEGQQNFQAPGGSASGANIVTSSCPSGSGQCIRNYKGGTQYLWVHDMNSYSNSTNVAVTFDYKFSSAGLNYQYFYFIPTLSGITNYVSAELASTCYFMLSDTAASSINNDTTGFSYNDTDPNTEYHIALAWDGSSCTMIIADSDNNTIASNTTTSDPHSHITETPLYFGADTYHASVGKYDYVDNLKLSDIIPVPDAPSLANYGDSFLNIISPESATTTSDYTYPVEIEYYMDSDYVSTSTYPYIHYSACPSGSQWIGNTNCVTVYMPVTAMNATTTATTTITSLQSGHHSGLASFISSDHSKVVIANYVNYDVASSSASAGEAVFLTDIQRWVDSIAFDCPETPTTISKANIKCHIPLAYLFDIPTVIAEFLSAMSDDPTDYNVDLTGISDSTILNSSSITIVDVSWMNSQTWISDVRDITKLFMWLMFFTYIFYRFKQDSTKE